MQIAAYIALGGLLSVLVAYLSYLFLKSVKVWSGVLALASGALLGALLLLLRRGLDLKPTVGLVTGLSLGALCFVLIYYFFYLDFAKQHPRTELRFGGFLVLKHKQKAHVTVEGEAEFETTFMPGWKATSIQWTMWTASFVFATAATAYVASQGDTAHFFSDWWVRLKKNDDFVEAAVVLSIIGIGVIVERLITQLKR